jgi:hypothetical protein
LFEDMARRAYRYGGTDVLADDPIVASWGRRGPVSDTVDDYILALAFSDVGGPAGLATVARKRSRPVTYEVAGLRRYPSPGYQAIAEDLADLTGTPPLKDNRLVLDAGLGKGIVDIFRLCRGFYTLHPLLVVEGELIDAAHDPVTGWTKAKKGEVASAVLGVLETGRLTMHLKHEATRNGLRALAGKAGLLTRALEMLPGSDRDDELVLAVGMGLYWGETRSWRIVA